jgi:replication-associated recombination protein RarA
MSTRKEPSDREGPPPTRQGHPLDEAASALQKAVRRSDSEAAVYWSRELLDHHPHYLWHRLAIIASEDIGLANPTLPATLAALRQSFYEAIKRKGEDGALFVTHAALLLARSPKSRLVDDCLLVVGDVYREPQDWALDRHTRRGRAMGRRWSHFWEQGAMLVDPETGEVGAEAIPNPYAERARKVPKFSDPVPGDVAERIEQLRLDNEEES